MADFAPDKYLARKGGATVAVAPVVESAGADDAGRLLAVDEDGKISPTVLPLGVGANVSLLEASEGLNAGNFVNIFDASGVAKVRKADNSNGRVAHGFVKEDVLSSGNASVYPLDGINANLTGLAPGKMHWLGTAGGVISTPLDESEPLNANTISQQLGIATSATELRTDDYGYVVL